MTKIYNCNKLDSIHSNWFVLWTSEADGYVTKLMFCESIPELDNNPGFIISVYDRLAMSVEKLVCITEDEMFRHAIIPIPVTADKETQTATAK